MTQDELKILAEKLLFTMNDDEYETLADEFQITLKQMEAIEKIPDIEKVEPLIYPFPLDSVDFREDEVVDELVIDDILANSQDVLYNQVKLPKVVE